MTKIPIATRVAMPLLAMSLLLVMAPTSATTLPSTANKTLTPQQQAAADSCKTYVSFRLGSLLSLHISDVSIPKPPASTWVVIGEDKSKTPAISFICRMRPGNQGWELEKLDLLQLAEPTLAQSASVSAFNR